MQQEVVPPRILLAQLPRNLPFDLPYPEGTIVVGSITGADESAGQIFMNTPLAPEPAVAFWQESLLAQGLDVPDHSPIYDPVQPAPDPNRAAAMLCTPDRETVVWISAHTGLADGTNARLSIEASYGPCQSLDEVPPRSASWAPLPSLETPTGVQQQSAGGNRGWDHVSYEVEVHTLLPLAELATSYNEQLQAADWQNLVVGNSEHATWSQWTFADADGSIWLGALYIFENPAAPLRKMLFLQAAQR